VKVTESMEAYSDFAYVYDELMDNTPYEEWCDRIVNLIKEYGVSGAQGQAGGCCPKDVRTKEEEALATERDLVLDLGCGTGTLTQLLALKGYDMIGVDSSSEMLNIAMEKQAEAGTEILYLLQDMRELELYSTVGTVISVCDSLNYILEEEELLDIFKLVNNYLYPGGIFIFDFNTVYKYEQIIGDTTIAENREDCSFIWENYYHAEEEINEYDLTIFVKEEGEHFRRFSETHYQRGYTAEQMIRLVEKAGLKVLLVKDSDTQESVTAKTQRVYLVAAECEKMINC